MFSGVISLNVFNFWQCIGKCAAIFTAEWDMLIEVFADLLLA